MPRTSINKKLILIRGWVKTKNYIKLTNIVNLFYGEKVGNNVFIFENTGEGKAEQLANLLKEVVYFNVYKVQGFTSHLPKKVKSNGND